MKVDRDRPEHVLHDLTVSVALAGDMEAVHLVGDNAPCCPPTPRRTPSTRSPASTGSARWRTSPRCSPGTSSTPSRQCTGRRSASTSTPGSGSADHSFARTGRETRTTTVTYDGDGTRGPSGLRDLVLLNSTGSEFQGFATDRYTTLPETDDRILCTSVEARWRLAEPPADWRTSYDGVRAALITAFADTYSRSLQQTLYAMGTRVVATCPGVVEVRLRLPNRHHLLVDLEPFGLDNPGEVFHVDDRPYGLIEGTVLADGASPTAGPTTGPTRAGGGCGDLDGPPAATDLGRGAGRRRRSGPTRLPIAGGTDLMVELNFGRRRPAGLLDLTASPSCRRGRSRTASSGSVRASPTRRSMPSSPGWLPGLAMASRTVGSPQIRNRGTVAGNLGSASPAGDAHPPLLAAGATVEVESVRGTRRVGSRRLLPRRQAQRAGARRADPGRPRPGHRRARSSSPRSAPATRW